MKRTAMALVWFGLVLLPGKGEGRLPDSGQTTCYDHAGAIISCPPPETPMAQDGSYTIHPMKFTDHGDGTVTDQVTGLMWQKEDDGDKYNWFEVTGTADPIHNPAAQNDVCGTLNLGGYQDWRVPTRKELIGIVNYENVDPAIDPMVFPNTKSDYYWSSTDWCYFSERFAWPIHFFGGGFSWARNKSDEGHVRCVRGDKHPPPWFSDNGDGTVSEKRSGLMWQRASASVPMDDKILISFSWSEALSYCENLSLAGYSDWRLPNIKELESIVDERNPEINEVVFTIYMGFFHDSDNDGIPDVWLTPYWTSTSLTSDPRMANWIDFNSENPGTSRASLKFPYYFVRCVRGGRSNPAIKGDIDGDGVVEMDDAILALQVLSGMDPEQLIEKEADVDGDLKVGMEEPLFILQLISGIR